MSWLFMPFDSFMSVQLPYWLIFYLICWLCHSFASDIWIQFRLLILLIFIAVVQNFFSFGRNHIDRQISENGSPGAFPTQVQGVPPIFISFVILFSLLWVIDKEENQICKFLSMLSNTSRAINTLPFLQFFFFFPQYSPLRFMWFILPKYECGQ